LFGTFSQRDLAMLIFMLLAPLTLMLVYNTDTKYGCWLSDRVTCIAIFYKLIEAVVTVVV